METTRLTRVCRVIDDHNAPCTVKFPAAQIDHRLDGDLGIDSLDMQAIVLALEEEFDIEIEDSECDGAPYHCLKTVQEILDFLDKKLGPEAPDSNFYLRLTENQFINRYKPETDAEGNYYVQREWFESEELIKQAIHEKRCWTAVDGDDGQFVIDWGNRVVNRLYNIITEKPIEDEGWIVQVYDEDPLIIECEVMWTRPTPELPATVVVNLRDLDLEEVTEENSSEIADHIAEMYDAAVHSFQYSVKT